MTETLDILKKPQTERLFWEKYRPMTIEDMALPERIKTLSKHGIVTNMLLVGPPGIGKSTLANILTKQHPFIKLNSKLGVDVLRNEVLQFCQTITSNIFDSKKTSNIKVVWLEEFDGASRIMQDELRAFIEQFEKTVRFIATANNISKIIEPIQSRFNVIDFTPKNSDEIKTVKIEYLKRLMKIAETEKLNILPEQIKEIVKASFPDLRKGMSVLQLTHITGQLNTEEQQSSDIEIYSLISNQANPTDTWNYLYTNWLDRLDTAFTMFDKKYWKWVEENRPAELSKMPNRMIKISQYVDVHLNNARDPFVTLCALVFELQQL
jgi:DNA polymerase III delta prime subunit